MASYIKHSEPIFDGLLLSTLAPIIFNQYPTDPVPFDDTSTPSRRPRRTLTNGDNRKVVLGFPRFTFRYQRSLIQKYMIS
ncbi:hypothetical protein TSTA_110430 [Talaromyces stipitatus ATCC 10500]|uniref:Uncharacterized protein n=1 Tax=Talaromyces stipitatus (strain ATCC 10500 / CBS 375.48 / QM 6759 / NRRL 1006) TaxID=441959 RepID=B8MUU3_TALSN|nr:uncharacterized protein TSTA_110430 [Talaromyces stipitatus ATCC 10500]EED11863.1 hypothetical protein TSTA_110430 [Talaromyces stipitatus ATCC 10500]